MNLGERIYQLRTEKKLSQEELADLLDVSRQSISKWETNGSVPELDKLVKLSEIFGVSLDTLVLNKEPTAEPEEKEISQESEIVQPGKRQRKIGIALLCIAALLWMLLPFSRFAYVAPILTTLVVAFGIICLRVRRFAGLWCAWMVYLVAEIFVSDVFRLGLTSVFNPWLYKGPGIMALAVWMLLVAFCSMIVVTFRYQYKAFPCRVRRDGMCAGFFWVAYLFSFVPPWIVTVREVDRKLNVARSALYIPLNTVWQAVFLACALVFTARLLIALWRKYKNKN